MGLIRKKPYKDHIKIKNQKYGDQYISVLSEALKLETQIKHCDLQGNRISQNGAQELFQNLHPKMQELNLAHNRIGKLGIEELNEYMT